jgi:hypothetical protein
MTDPDVNFGVFDFISTLITLSIMLPIFYIVYLVWWKHDKPLEQGPLANIARKFENIKITHKIRELDSGKWPKGNPLIITAIIVFIFCLASIPVAGWIGTDDPDKFADRMIGESSKTIMVYDNGSITDSGILSEGSETEIPIEFINNYIISIRISLTWTDEGSSFFGGTNEPDTFTIQLLDPDGNILEEDSGDSGNLGISWSPTDPEDKQYNGTFTVLVMLDTAGDDFSRFGLRSQQDTSNDYSAIIDYSSYYYKSGTGDDADVRWHS